MKRCFIPLILFLISFSAFAEIKLPAILGDHMVLQQQTKANLWGWASINKQISITCSWNGKTYTTKSNSKGEWLQAVDTPLAGGPYEITISDGTILTIKDVLIGEVWLCSGQSNMEMPLEGFDQGNFVEGAQEYIANASSERPLRMAQLELEYSLTPKDDCTTKWCVNAPENLPKMSACAVFFADNLQRALQVPVGIIMTSWGASMIETWMTKESIQHAVPDKDFSILQHEDQIKKCPQQAPIVVYNAMVYPLRHYTVKGMIWYQGESNIGNYKEYAKLQKEFVCLWRKTFNNPTMGFYYVQIAPFEYPYGEKHTCDAAFLREQQAISEQEIENCAMVSTIDIGLQGIIHPQYKIPVAQRLTYCALAMTYGRKIEYQCPSYVSQEIQGSTIIIRVSHAKNGLHNSLGRDKKIEGFEIAGEDKRYYPAEVSLIHGGDERILVSNPNVPQPVAARYCFKNYQAGTLVNNFGLPLAPFRTDSWEEVYGPKFWW